MIESGCFKDSGDRRRNNLKTITADTKFKVI